MQRICNSFIAGATIGPAMLVAAYGVWPMVFFACYLGDCDADPSWPSNIWPFLFFGGPVVVIVTTYLSLSSLLDKKKRAASPADPKVKR